MKPINLKSCPKGEDRGKRIGKSKYKYVSIYENCFQAYIPKFKWTKYFHDEREAAKGVDLKFIENGKEPVNILKRVRIN
jgi:hypothetical protein